MIRLRPVDAQRDTPLLERLADPSVAGPFNHFPETDGAPLRVALPGAGRVIVELADGTAIGDLTWFGVPYGPTRPSLAWRIGITILPEHRNQGHGARAQRLLAERLLETTPSHRVEADTSVDNMAEQKALERAGFLREGVIRGSQLRNGEWGDQVMYGFTRAELQSPRP